MKKNHDLDILSVQTILRYDPKADGWWVMGVLVTKLDKARRDCERAEYMRVKG